MNSRSANLTDWIYTAWSAVFSTLRPFSDHDYETHRTLLRLSTYFPVTPEAATAADLRMLEDLRLARQAIELMGCDSLHDDMVVDQNNVCDGVTPVMLSALRGSGREAQGFFLSAAGLAGRVCPSAMATCISGCWKEVREFAQGQQPMLAANTRILILNALIAGLEEKHMTVKANPPRPHVTAPTALSMQV